MPVIAGAGERLVADDALAREDLAVLTVALRARRAALVLRRQPARGVVVVELAAHVRVEDRRIRARPLAVASEGLPDRVLQRASVGVEVDLRAQIRACREGEEGGENDCELHSRTLARTLRDSVTLPIADEIGSHQSRTESDDPARRNRCGCERTGGPALHTGKYIALEP